MAETKIIKYHAMIAALLINGTACLPATAIAQETNQLTTLPTTPPDAQKAPSNEEQAIINLLKIIDQVGVILPGAGFKSFKLGQTREQLVKLWGNPQQATRKVLQYQLDRNTVIQFHGKKIIESIAVIGQFGSVARVENGIVFGMTPAQVIEFFDVEPDKKNKTTLRYKNLGIEFFFKNQTLIKIVVFEA